MVMNKRLGTNASICRNVGSYGSPSWVALRSAMDIKFGLAPSATFDASDRSSAVNRGIPTRFKLPVEFEAIWDGGVGLTAVRTAFLAGTGIDLAVLDAPPASSGWGAHLLWAVTQFALEFPLKDGQKLKVKLEPHGQYGTSTPVFPYTDATGSTGGTETQPTKKIGTVASVNDSSNNPIACEDVKLTLDPETFDSSDRTLAIDTVIPSRFKYGAELGLLWDSGNAQHVAFRTAFLAGDPITLKILDGAYVTSGSWGVSAGWAITEFPADHKLKDGQKYSIKLEPHGNGTAPSLITI